MKKHYYKLISTSVLLCALISFNTIVFGQPTDHCNNFQGQGIPVSNQCEPRGFNVLSSYVNNTTTTSCNSSTSSTYKDAWWWFEAKATTTIIRYYPVGGNVTAGYYNPTLSVYGPDQTCNSNNSASQNNNRTSTVCSNDGGNGVMEVITMSTEIGKKYRIRVQNTANNSGNGQGATVMYGQICVMNLSSISSAPCTAYSINVDSIPKPNYFQLNNASTSVNFNATPACGSYNSNKRKAFFDITMPSTDLVIETEKKGTSTSTSSINTAMAVYKVNGNCPNQTYSLINCVTGGASYGMTKMHITNSSGATTGSKLLVVVWSENSTDDYFGISAYTSTQCGNPLGLKNDFCENPAIMYKAPNTTFSASTSGVFTTDQFTEQTSNLNCTGGQSSIYVHNNSWYQFTAESTTEVFPFSAECKGIQAVVFEAGYTNTGCCNGSFTRKSNCISQMAEGQSAGIITATNLVVGRKYLLMVDGYAGAQCNFTIKDWNAQNILLGVNLLDFSAEADKHYNVLRWRTSSEVNNDYFTVLRSIDGLQWEEIEVIDGAGTTNQETTYETIDQNLRLGIVYYKLRQTDFDGTTTHSDIIILNRSAKENGIINVSPNPTNGDVTIDILSSEADGVITVTTLNGKILHTTSITNKGIHAINIDMRDFPQGMYFVNYTDATTKSVRQLIKY